MEQRVQSEAQDKREQQDLLVSQVALVPQVILGVLVPRVPLERLVPAVQLGHQVASVQVEQPDPLVQLALLVDLVLWVPLGLLECLVQVVLLVRWERPGRRGLLVTQALREPLDLLDPRARLAVLAALERLVLLEYLENVD